MGEIISRAEAKGLGLKLYFTGFQCKRGHINSRRVDNSQCIECARLIAGSWNRANPIRHGVHSASYRKRHSGILMVKSRQWAIRNPDKVCAIVKRWRLANPTHVAAINRNRRARVKGAEGKHTHGDIQDILVSQRHECVYCSVALTADNRHIDHIVPISVGGHNGRNNIQILCGTCNMRKSSKTHEEFLDYMGISR